MNSDILIILIIIFIIYASTRKLGVNGYCGGFNVKPPAKTPKPNIKSAPQRGATKTVVDE